MTRKKDSDSEGKVGDTVIGTALSHTTRINYVPALVVPLKYTREADKNGLGGRQVSIRTCIPLLPDTHDSSLK